MRWPTLLGKTRTQPKRGRWFDWRQRIADDCQGRCVYCAIHESRFGGVRNFHVEHYRPKSHFPQYEDSIANLFLACSICNVLKSDDWPGEPCSDLSAPCYPDPSTSDYNALFRIDPSTFELDSDFVAGRYVRERLLLNRGQLISERRLADTVTYLGSFEKWLDESVEQLTGDELRDALKIVLALEDKFRNAAGARPYREVDVRRPAKKAAERKSK